MTENASQRGVHIDLRLMVIHPLPQQIPELFVFRWPHPTRWTEEEREACALSKEAIDNAARLLGLEFEVSR